MYGPSKEVLAELAFAMAHGAPLTRQMEAVAAFAETAPETKALLEEYLGVIRATQGVMSAPRDASPTVDDNLLAEYVDGVMEPSERERVEGLLARDPEALRAGMALNELRRIVADQPPSVLEYVIGVAAKGLRMLSHPETGFALETPVPVPTLGGGPAIPTREFSTFTPNSESEAQVRGQSSFTWIQFASNLRMTLTATHAEQERVDLTLRVNDTAGPLRGGRLTVRCNANLVQSELLPVDGTVSLRGLEIAAYDFEIVPPGGPPVRFAVRLSDQA